VNAQKAGIFGPFRRLKESLSEGRNAWLEREGSNLRDGIKIVCRASPLNLVAGLDLSNDLRVVNVPQICKQPPRSLQLICSARSI
jgi:hypothetical protein